MSPTSSPLVAWLPTAALPSLGSRVTESQAYTDIHTKDRPAVAGGPSVDKCVFFWGGVGAKGVNEGRLLTYSDAIMYGRRADLFMCELHSPALGTDTSAQSAPPALPSHVLPLTLQIRIKKQKKISNMG